MSSPSNPPFECHWQPSRRLSWCYALAWGLAVLGLLLSAAPGWLKGLVALGCMLHAWWVVPRALWLVHPESWRGLRLDADGWQLWSPRRGWQAVQLLPDSLALPALVVLRVRVPGHRFASGLCIPADSLPKEVHRQLRVRLKFSRHRWAVPG